MKFALRLTLIIPFALFLGAGCSSFSDDYGAGHGNGGSVKAAAPQFTPDATPDSYTAGDGIVLISDTPNADIYYSINGSEYKKYDGALSLKSCAEQYLITAYATRPDMGDSDRVAKIFLPLGMPRYDASAGEESIVIENLYSAGATEYDVYWREADGAYISEDELDLGDPAWSKMADAYQDYSDSCKDAGCGVTISGLQANKAYLVAVIARNQHGRSLPRYYYDDPATPAADNIVPLTPRVRNLTGIEAAPTFMSKGYTRKIELTGISSPGVCRYKIRWRKLNSTGSFLSHDTYRDNANQQECEPASYTIYGLEPWTSYEVCVVPMSLDGVEGTVSTKTVHTAIEGGIYSHATKDAIAVFNGLVWLSYTRIHASGIVLPTGTSYFRISNYTVTFRRAYYLAETPWTPQWLYTDSNALTRSSTTEYPPSCQDVIVYDDSVHWSDAEFARFWSLPLPNTDTFTIYYTITAVNEEGMSYSRSFSQCFY